MSIPNTEASEMKLLNLSVQLLSTINNTQNSYLNPKSKPIGTLQKLKNRLTQVNKKFDYNRQKTQTTLNWIKQQGINLNNIRYIAQQQRKQQKHKIVQAPKSIQWQQYQQKQYQNLPFDDFIAKNQQKIAYNVIKQCLQKTDTKKDHMKQLRRRNMRIFNGQNVQNIQRPVKLVWQIIMQQYYKVINQNIDKSQGINLNYLSQQTINIYAKYKHQFVPLFNIENLFSSNKSQLQFKKNQQHVRSSILNIKSISQFNNDQILLKDLIYNCLKFDLQEVLIQKYELFQDGYDLNKYCVVFFHLYVNMIINPKYMNNFKSIIKKALIKMTSFVFKIKKHLPKWFKGYYLVFLQSLLISKAIFNTNQYQSIVEQSCLIINLQKQKYEQLINSNLGDIYSYYLQNIDDFQQITLSNIQNVKQSYGVSRISI